MPPFAIHWLKYITIRLFKGINKTYNLLNFYLNSFKIWVIVFSPYGIMLLFTKEPLDCGSYLDNTYLRLHENVMEIS